MQRTVALSRGQNLWREGDPALTVAVVTSGKLAVRSADRVVGVLGRRMVLGEAALTSVEGQLGTRTHDVQALEDGTEVTEYPASLVKEMLDQGRNEVAGLILRTLTGQICRNWALVALAHKGMEHLEQPIQNVTVGLLESQASLEAIRDWPQFLTAFRLLVGIRDLSEEQREQLVPPGRENLDEILRASSTMVWLFREQKAGAYLEDFLAAERERRLIG